MTIESGQRIALVGQPGSGKSTLSKIPSRLYKIDTGKVLFDGININQIDKKILSQNLGVVPQDSFLLNRSILKAFIHSVLHPPAIKKNDSPVWASTAP
ncbi:ATP-binding cassette domain-containing protein [Streptococcus pneumoniae]|uniref:ATP-binding cassette domain-containing protein n=1 Tax=Streptococcus pneumoniae TaxID=1313 RepID=UPI001E3736ED|nr:ATP-binding cassette domain-containing protein [Streptococcus pneumoniae]